MANPEEDILRTKGFSVEFVGAGKADEKKPAGSWLAWRGGVPTFEVCQTENSETGLRQYSPKRRYVTDIELTGLITPDRTSHLKFCNEVFGGKRTRTDITLRSLTVDNKPGPSHNYFSVMLKRFKFPRLDIRSGEPAKEVCTFEPYRHEAATG